jgi:hypothetical protein
MSNGKGDSPRPLSVDQKTFANNWDRAFGTPICEYSGLPHTASYDDVDKEYTELLASGLFWELFPGLTGDWSQDQARWKLAILSKESQLTGLYDTLREEKGND